VHASAHTPEIAFGLTSRRLESPGSTGFAGWDALRQPDTLGIALFHAREPRLAAADPAFSTLVGAVPGSLNGLLVSELEFAHPFAASPEVWRRHVLNVSKVDHVRWPTWLLPADGPALRAVMRLRLQNIEGARYLLAELTELKRPSIRRQDDPRSTSLDELPFAACRIAADGSLIASNAAAMAFLECEFDLRNKAYSLALPRQVLSAEREPLATDDVPWFRAIRDGRTQNAGAFGMTRSDGSLAWVLVCVAPDKAPPDSATYDSAAFDRAAFDRAAPGQAGCETAALDPQSVVPGFAVRNTSSALITLFDVTAAKEASDALLEADRKLRRTISSVTNLQDQLARSEHMASLGLMAAGVAHEINNPLSYILSNLSFAAGRAIDQESRLALREAMEGAGRVRDIVRDLKTLSRMETEDDLKPVDVRNAVDAALKLAFDEVRNRARIQRHFSEVPCVLGDETRLVQVMLNLVTNAAQSIPSGAPEDNQITVEVKLAETAGEVVIVVIDTGAGISEAHLPKVFEPFFTTKPAGEGTGLGLSICHRLIHAMGGRIHVSSEEGRGSRFSVFLSIAASDPELEAPHSEHAASSARRLRLLIVDDEVLVARAVRRMFDKEFRVEIALNGHAALEKLANTDYDVVLCDLMMPGITGLDVYRQVRSENEPLARRFVFATGGLFSQELSDNIKRLSNMIVEKPFDPEELRRVIKAAVPEPRSGTSPVPTVQR
jgi:signal transduction histidine kinase/ActR/RegA family two-component response regulator